MMLHQQHIVYYNLTLRATHIVIHYMSVELRASLIEWGPVASRLLKASLMRIVYSTSLILCLFMYIQLLLLYFYYYNILTAEFFYLY